MSYDTVLTTLDGAQVSELVGARGRTVTVPVVGMATGAVSVNADSPDADFLLEGDALVRFYETDDEDGSRELLGHLRLVTAEETSDGQAATVTATFADPYWVLLRRLCGKSAAGYSRGTALAPVDRGTIISDLVDTTNAESPTGVRMGAVTASSSTYVDAWRYRPIGEAIAELGATLDGPDWRIRPIEYDAGYIGELDVLPSIGEARPNAAFECGPETLANVRSYRRAVSNETVANRVFHLPTGFPDNATASVLSDQDTDSQARRGLLEAIVTQDLTVDDLRTKLLAYHVQARRAPRQTISFDPVSGGRAPRFGAARAFYAGDVVPFRATSERELAPGVRDVVKRIDVLARVYNYSVTIDDLGVGTPTLTVSPT